METRSINSQDGASVADCLSKLGDAGGMKLLRAQQAFVDAGP